MMMKGMKGMKGKILQKLQSTIQVVPYLKYDQPSSATSPFLARSPPPPPHRSILADLPASNSPADLTPLPLSGEADLPKLVRNLNAQDKENIRPADSCASRKTNTNDNSNNKIGKEELDSTQCESKNRSPVGVWSYRRPDLNSETLFDPDLLAAFEKAVMEHIESFKEAERKAMELIGGREEEYPFVVEEPPLKVPRTGEEDDPLMEFEKRCPPGGKDAVVVYTTTLRGIRKTFEDCNSIRFLLANLKVKFLERDLSMHLEFREELWRLLGGRPIPPRLFIRGRYIGGADEVLGLHEQGRLLPLLQGMPTDSSSGDDQACRGCGGMRFVMCSQCRGSHKVYIEESGIFARCTDCNENGLILCSICC